MIPSFNERGVLPPGKPYKTSWAELVKRFGTNEHRLKLIVGMKTALFNLKSAGCRAVYIDGSFITSKSDPEDWDGCWQLDGVNLKEVDYVILDADRLPDKMKAKYKGDLLIHAPRLPGGDFISFFQTDRQGVRKGIVVLDLESLS